MTQVEVLEADQEKINKFGNLNSQCTALDVELAALEAKKKSYDGAAEELEMAQLEEVIDKVPFRMGTAFVELPIDISLDEVRKDCEEIGNKVEVIKAQIAEKKAEMATLRAILYGKFGRENINLGD
jgi:prefoldin subunit 4